MTPPEKRLRVVKLSGEPYRVVDGMVEREVGGRWWGASLVPSGVVTELAALLAHPTETVEDDS